MSCGDLRLKSKARFLSLASYFITKLQVTPLKIGIIIVSIEYHEDLIPRMNKSP